MSNKNLSPSAPDVIDNPRKPRPKTPEQIMELIGMLPYEDQVLLFTYFKADLAELTADRIQDAETTAQKLRDFHGGLNGQG